jgi:hypothetical protein
VSRAKPPFARKTQALAHRLAAKPAQCQTRSFPLQPTLLE